MKVNRPLLRLSILLVSLAASVAAEEQSTQSQKKPIDTHVMAADTGRIMLEIERKTLGQYQARETVDVYVNTQGSEIAGFDFKVACTSPAVEIVEIIGGKFVDSCRWEYFNGHRVREPNDPRYPKSVWQAVGLSQMGLDTASAPLCLSTDRPISLFRIVLEPKMLRGREDSIAALFFWWDDCADNVFSGVTGEDLHVSSNVNDYFPVELQRADGVFPTRLGAPAQCINPNARVPLRRRIDCHNGGIVFGYPSPVDSLAVPRPEPPGADSSGR